MKYCATLGARISDEAADTIGRYLDKLPEVTPEAMVEAAKSDKSCPYREHLLIGKNAEAAKRWRLEQCGHLVRMIAVFEDDKPKNELVRARMSVSFDDGKNRYERVDVVASNTAMRDQVISDARKDAGVYANRYMKMCQQFRIKPSGEFKTFLSHVWQFSGKEK